MSTIEDALEKIDDAQTEDRVVVPAKGSNGESASGRKFHYHKPSHEGALRANCGNWSHDGTSMPLWVAKLRDFEPCPTCFGGDGQ